MEAIVLWFDMIINPLEWSTMGVLLKLMLAATLILIHVAVRERRATSSDVLSVPEEVATESAAETSITQLETTLSPSQSIEWAFGAKASMQITEEANAAAELKDQAKPVERAMFYPRENHSDSSSQLADFDSLVARFEDRTRKHLVLADFLSSKDETDTLQAVLRKQAQLKRAICREMSWNVDLIPHSRLSPNFSRYAAKHLVAELLTTYDQIVVFDEEVSSEKWEIFFQAAGLTLARANFDRNTKAVLPQSPAPDLGT